MAATIRTGPWQATIDNQRWTSPEPSLERLLNAMLSGRHPWDYEPDPDDSAAAEAIERLGGEFLHRDPPPLRRPGVVY